MLFLILGLVLFFLPHLVAVFTPLRDALIGAAGENQYKMAFTVLSVIGLILIGYGHATAGYEQIWAPFEWSRAAALHSMPIVFILFAAANMKTYMRKWLRHPMMIATLIWALLHLSANGDLASLLLFGSFGAFAILSILFGQSRKRNPVTMAAVKYDAMAVVGGLVVFALVLYFHKTLFGVAVLNI